MGSGALTLNVFTTNAQTGDTINAWQLLDRHRGRTIAELRKLSCELVWLAAYRIQGSARRLVVR